MSKSAKKRKKERERKLLLEQQQDKDPHARENPHPESPREQVVAKSLFRAPDEKQVPAKSPQSMELSVTQTMKEQIVGDNANNNGNPSKAFGSRKRTLTAVGFVYPKTKDTYHFGGKQIAGKSSESPKDAAAAEGKTDNAPSYRTNVSIEEILNLKKKRRKGESGKDSPGRDTGKGQSATTHAESTPRSPIGTKTPDPTRERNLQVDGKGDRKMNSNGNSHTESTPNAGKGQSTTKTPEPTRDLKLQVEGKGDRKKNSNGNAHVEPTPNAGKIQFTTKTTDPSRERKLQVDGKGDRKKNSNGHGEPKSKSPIESDSSREQKILIDGKGDRKKNSNNNGHAESTPKSSRETVARAPEAPESGHLSGMTVEKVVRDEMGCRPRANSTDGELNLPQGGLCDERKVLQAHKWNLDKHDFSMHVSPKGFVNLGNTCFLNSTLQCLAYLPPMCQSLMAMPEAHDIGKNGKAGKTSQGKKVTLMLRSLFRQVHGANGSNFAGHALAPKSIVRAVPSLGSVGSRNGYKFRPGRQEDAHEFLVHLLDAMNDGELKESGMNPHASGWRDRMPIARLDETTFIHRIFGGYLRSQVRCTSCGYCSNTYDPFLDLSLEVSRKSCHSISNAILEFTRKETLDSENRWKCSGCKKRVCASKQLTVFRPPLTLCVQLKRFTFGGSGFGFGGGHKNFSGGGQGGKKISKPIEFPADLKLPLSDSRSCEYALTGIIIHVGGSASSGHYTAYVKKPSTNGGHQWFHMDDSFVESVSERTVLKQRDAYVLFYCRKEVKVEFPSPPLRSSMTADEATKFGRVRAKARADSITEDSDTRNMSKAGEKSLSPIASSGSAVAKKSNPTPAQSSRDVAPESSLVQSTQKEQSSSTSEAGEDEVGRGPSVKDSTASIAFSVWEGSEKKPKVASSTNSKLSRIATTSHSSSESLGSESSDSEPELTSTSTEVTGKLASSLGAASASREEDESSEKSSSGSSTSEDSDEKPKAAAGISNKISRDTSNAHFSSEESDDSDGESGAALPSKRNNDSVKQRRSQHSSSESSENAVASGKMTPPPVAALVPEEDESSSSSSESSVASDSPLISGKSSPSSIAASSTDVSESGVGEKKGNSIFQTAKNAIRTRVVFGKAEGRGKVEVMMGPRFKTKAWKPSTVPAAKGQEYHLLGNLKVDAWDDDSDDDSPPEARRGQTPASNERAGIVQQVEKKEQKRKRQMFVDRWDANLDLGKVSTCHSIFTAASNCDFLRKRLNSPCFLQRCT